MTVACGSTTQRSAVVSSVNQVLTARAFFPSRTCSSENIPKPFSLNSSPASGWSVILFAQSEVSWDLSVLEVPKFDSLCHDHDLFLHNIIGKVAVSLAKGLDFKDMLSGGYSFKSILQLYGNSLLPAHCIFAGSKFLDGEICIDCHSRISYAHAIFMVIPSTSDVPPTQTSKASP